MGLSAATHTRLLAELVDLGFGESTSGGPHKRFTFFERDELWRRLLQVQTETILRKVRLSELPPNPVYAGNHALSRLSRLRLTEDEPIEIALSQKEFDSLPQREREVLYELLQAANLSPEPLMETL